MARNIQPNEMVESVLFTIVAPNIQRISNERLLFELCLASTDTNVDANQRQLSMCMSWDDTPQGFEYWSALHLEHMRNNR